MNFEFVSYFEIRISCFAALPHYDLFPERVGDFMSVQGAIFFVLSALFVLINGLWIYNEINPGIQREKNLKPKRVLLSNNCHPDR